MSRLLGSSVGQLRRLDTAERRTRDARGRAEVAQRGADQARSTFGAIERQVAAALRARFQSNVDSVYRALYYAKMAQRHPAQAQRLRQYGFVPSTSGGALVWKSYTHNLDMSRSKAVVRFDLGTRLVSLQAESNGGLHIAALIRPGQSPQLQVTPPSLSAGARHWYGVAQAAAGR